MISKEILDAALKKKYQQMLKAGELPGSVVFTSKDFFGNGVVVECKSCRRKGFVRPWLYLLAKEHGIDVFICFSCALRIQPRQFIADSIRYAASIESYAMKWSSRK